MAQASNNFKEREDLTQRIASALRNAGSLDLEGGVLAQASFGPTLAMHVAPSENRSFTYIGADHPRLTTGVAPRGRRWRHGVENEGSNTHPNQTGTTLVSVKILAGCSCFQIST